MDILLKKSGRRLKRLDEPVPGAWINAVNPSAEERRVLVKHGIPREFIHSSLDRDEQPRLDEDGAKLIVLRVPHMVGGELETVPLGIAFVKDTVITISRELTAPVEVFLKGPPGLSTAKRTRFLFQLFWSTVKSYLKYLNHIDATLDEAEENVSGSLENSEIFRLLRVQKTLTYFKSGARGNQKVLSKIITGKFLRLYEQDEDILEDIIIDNEQALEMIDTYIQLTANTMGAYEGIVGNNVNRVMKVLTVINVILAVPTILAGLYGMNLALPFQSHPTAFWGIVGVSALMSAGILAVMGGLKWL